VHQSNRVLILLVCLLAVTGLPSAMAVDEARQAYDKMVEEATREADEYVEEKQKKMDDAKRESRVKKDAELQERIQAEQERIMEQKQAVQNRGLGPNFTQGMKDNLLRELQERLDRLNSDPEAYFANQ
jgi:vacuolar-type H+-ATPase subunit E/Vma4